jgi:hypothetical protein
VGRSPPFPDPKTVKNDRENKKGVADMEAVHPFLDPKSPNVYPNTACRAQKSPPYRIHYSYRCVQRKEKMRQKETEKEEKKRERPVLCPAPLVSTQRM